MGVVVVATALLAACGADGDAGPDTTTDGNDPVGDTSVSAPPSATGDTPTAEDLPYEEVEFSRDDGDTRAGRLFGDPDAQVAIVLSHMGSDGDSPDDWTPMAETLAAEGYLVMTYERVRPRYRVWEDLVGAARHLRDDVGVQTVIVGGASIGAMASLHVALASDPEVNGVVWIAGVESANGMSFDEATVSQLACPMLVASGDQDGFDAAPVAEDIAAWAPTAADPLILPTSAHGTDIFAEGGDAAADLQAAIVAFVESVAAQPPTQC